MDEQKKNFAKLLQESGLGIFTNLLDLFPDIMEYLSDENIFHTFEYENAIEEGIFLFELSTADQLLLAIRNACRLKTLRLTNRLGNALNRENEQDPTLRELTPEKKQLLKEIHFYHGIASSFDQITLTRQLFLLQQLEPFSDELKNMPNFQICTQNGKAYAIPIVLSENVSGEDFFEALELFSTTANKSVTIH